MLTLSTKGRYAARIMVYLAMTASDAQPARKREIADAEGITPDYVEQILMRLRTADLVRSYRGVKGGFTLARDAAGITVTDILKAVEGPISVVPCIDEDCKRSTACATRPVWKRANEALEKVFGETTVGDMARDCRRFSRLKEAEYHI